MTPLLFPVTESGVARVTIDIERVDYAAPEASGRQGGVQAGWPLWMAVYDLDSSDPDSGDLWRSFKDRLRGRQRLFFGGDPTRSFPKSYANGFGGMLRAGGGAFPGSALAWAQNIDAAGDASLALTGLPAGFIMRPRDLVGFKWDAAGAAAASYGRRTMARAVAPAVASAAGAITILIEPPIDTSLVPAGAIAHLDNPCCVMRIDPDKTNLGPVGAGGAMGGGTITAVQDLRP